MALVHSPVTNVTLEHHWGSQETNTFTVLIQTVFAGVPTSAAVERFFSRRRIVKLTAFNYQGKRFLRSSFDDLVSNSFDAFDFPSEISRNH